MNDHAKEIWKAWADGKTVQVNSIDVWRDADPCRCEIERQPQNIPSFWRVKPEREEDTSSCLVILESEFNSKNSRNRDIRLNNKITLLNAKISLLAKSLNRELETHHNNDGRSVEIVVTEKNQNEPIS